MSNNFTVEVLNGVPTIVPVYPSPVGVPVGVPVYSLVEYGGIMTSIVPPPYYPPEIAVTNGKLHVNGNKVDNFITIEPVRIDLPLINLPNRRVHSIKECFLVLGDKTIDYKIVATYDKKNEDTDVWEDASCNYRWSRLRSCIVGVEMYLDKEDKTWDVELHWSGGVTSWAFENPKEALKVYEKLKEYFVN